MFYMATVASRFGAGRPVASHEKRGGCKAFIGGDEVRVLDTGSGR